jgi:hypothetical protein
MARQTGPLKYKGNIGGVRHFKMKGLKGSFAGMAGGASAEQIKTAPEFKRTRENMNEFSGCAAAGKSVRVGLSSLMKQMSDSQLTGRLTAIMKKINLEDQSEARGYRAILISQQSQYLKGLVFNKSASFDSAYNGRIEITPNADRNGVDIVATFNAANNINPPAGATHFRLLSAVSIVSDYAYNASTKVYEPLEPDLNEQNSVVYMPYTDFSSADLQMTVNNSIASLPTMTGDVSLIVCIGIEFYQQVGVNYYLFSSGNALKVHSIV